MRTVGYVRVSTEEQATGGVSLDSQRAKLDGYAALYGLALVAVEVDAGVSAKTLDRPGLRSALARIDAGDVEGFLVAKLDRLSRSILDWNVLIERYFGPNGRAQLFSVGDSIDTRTAAGRLVLNVLMSVAQWERETICERTADGLRHLRSLGQRTGTIPYGQRLAGDGRTLLPDPEEMGIVGEVCRLSSAGLSLRRIASTLDARGVPTKSGRPWSHTTIARMLDRPLNREAPTNAAE